MNKLASAVFGLLFLAIILGVPEKGQAYKVETHREITEAAFQKSVNSHLFIEDFGFDGESAFIDGSELEDGENFFDARWTRLGETYDRGAGGC